HTRFFFFQAEDGIRDPLVTGVQTCALPISAGSATTKIDEAALVAHLKTRVKGQDVILEDVAKLIRLQMAKQQKDKPICNLIFLRSEERRVGKECRCGW